MKLRAPLSVACAALLLSMAPARAQEQVWQTSYQLEAAGRYAEALSALESVPVNGPEGEFKGLRRAWLFYLSGSYNEAIREYRLATERNPKSLDARLGLALAMLADKRWREAEQVTRAALAIAPNHYIGLLRLTVAQEGQRDWSGMLATTTTMVSAYPSDASAHVYQARAYAGLGRREEAVAAYQATLTRLPGHLEARAYIDRK